jgi:hypothetical protein
MFQRCILPPTSGRWWRQYLALKHRSISIRIQGAISHKAVIFKKFMSFLTKSTQMKNTLFFELSTVARHSVLQSYSSLCSFTTVAFQWQDINSSNTSLLKSWIKYGIITDKVQWEVNIMQALGRLQLYSKSRVQVLISIDCYHFPQSIHVNRLCHLPCHAK